MKRYLTIAALLISLVAGAQNSDTQGLPPEAYYLMPEFRPGMIYFNGQLPAQGKLNICALDNTLRFIDKSGKEMEATGIDNVAKVKIDTVFFIRSGGLFYRMYPVRGDAGVALKRDVKFISEGKTGAFGTTSQTASIRENNSVYADGIAYEINKDKEVKYEIVETLYLYKGDDVYTLNKNNLRRVFPDKKAEIDAFFKARNPIPSTLPETLELLKGWAE